jgi:hypothetical protein
VATYTIYASTTNGGRITSTDNNYNNARNGSGSVSTSGQPRTGQFKQSVASTVYEAFLDFDTSILAGKTIVSATLECYLSQRYLDASFTAQARLRDFGTALATGDWVAGGSLSALTLLATLASGSTTVSAYNQFADVALAANINTAGSTRLLICSSRTVSNSAPPTSTSEYLVFDSIGGTNPPRLVIETSETTGELTESIGDFTLTADGDVITNASLNESLGDFILSAVGGVGGAGQGVLAESIGDFTLTADGDVIINGYFDESIGEFTLAATSVVPLDGELLESIGEFTLVAAGGKPINGTLTESIGEFQLFATSLGGITASLTESIGEFQLVAYQSDPPWPQFDDFPQSPLDGTWETSPGEDTLRSEQETGARQARDRNGGNYGEAQFSIMLTTYSQRLELDRFYEQACAHGARRFVWKCPETDDARRWVWKAPPVVRSLGLSKYIVECALRKEAA